MARKNSLATVARAEDGMEAIQAVLILALAAAMLLFVSKVFSSTFKPKTDRAVDELIHDGSSSLSGHGGSPDGSGGDTGTGKDGGEGWLGWIVIGGNHRIKDGWQRLTSPSWGQRIIGAISLLGAGVEVGLAVTGIWGLGRFIGGRLLVLGGERVMVWWAERGLGRIIAYRTGGVVEYFIPRCFTPDTLVLTDAGRRPIGQVEAGQKVRCFDFTRGRWVLAEVQARHDSSYSGTLVTIHLQGHAITATSGHPFWVVTGRNLDARPRPFHLATREDEGRGLCGRWLDSHHVRAGDILLGEDGRRHRVVRVTLREVAQTEVCNLTVKDGHTYAVSGCDILVHNAAWCTVLERIPSMSVLREEMAKTLTRLHGHHIVFQGNWLHSPAIRAALDRATAVLKAAGIPLLRDINLGRRIATTVATLEREVALLEIQAANGVPGAAELLARAQVKLKSARAAMANLTWAVNGDHSKAYIEAVARRLEDAWAKGGRPAVLKALEEISELLRNGQLVR